MQPSANSYSGNDKSGSGLISASTTFDSEIKPLKVLLEFTAETAAAIKKDITAFPVFSEGVMVDIPQLPSPHFTQLTLLTEIPVYKSHWLKYKKAVLPSLCRLWIFKK